MTQLRPILISIALLFGGCALSPGIDLPSGSSGDEGGKLDITLGSGTGGASTGVNPDLPAVSNSGGSGGAEPCPDTSLGGSAGENGNTKLELVLPPEAPPPIDFDPCK